MSDEKGNILWRALTKTVTPLGQPFRRNRAHIERTTVEPNTLDLHGMSIHVAFRKVVLFIQNTPHREITIITGRSGQIAYEFRDWLQQCPRVISYSIQSKGGAYILRLK